MSQYSQITEDIATKCADDVLGAIKRALSIAPPPRLPILLMAGVSAIGMIAAELDDLAGQYDPKRKPEPNPANVMLAGLLLARCGMASGPSDGIRNAYTDLEILKKAGRLS